MNNAHTLSTAIHRGAIVVATLLLSGITFVACTNESDKIPQWGSQGAGKAEESTEEQSALPENAPKDAAKGGEIFAQYCATCHQAAGQGMPPVYPPLAGSEFLADKQKTIDGVVNGLQGPITVKGEKYDAIMPPLPPNYDDAQAAAILNFVSYRFGDGSWSTTAEEVAAIRK